MLKNPSIITILKEVTMNFHHLRPHITRYMIAKAYVLCGGNMETRGRIVYAPIYMTMFIEKKQTVRGQIFRIDMTGLR